MKMLKLAFIFVTSLCLLLYPRHAQAGGAIIVQTSTNKFVSMSNASFARLFDIGTWSAMRISLRIMSEFTGTLTSLTPRIVIGLCCGSTNQVFDATTPNFIGVRSTNATWTAYAQAIDSIGATAMCATKRVGSTWTDADDLTAGDTCWFSRASEASGGADMLMLEITKGTPNWTLKLFFNSNGGNGQTIAYSDWLTQSVAITPSVSFHTWSAGVTIPFDEVAGTVNNVLVGWDRSEATMEVSDIAIIKMAP